MKCRLVASRFFIPVFFLFTLTTTLLSSYGKGALATQVAENQCSQTADIVLTSDRTTSIANSGDLTNVRNSTVTLATDLLSIAGNRVGLVAFGGVTCNSSNVCTNNGQQASIARAIADNNTANNNQLIARINSAYSTTSSVGTHYLAALTQAQTAMGGAPNPANPNKVIVFFTDGQNDDNAGSTTTLANNIKASGIRIFTVGFNITSGSNADNVLKGIASSPTDAYLASAANLTAIFNAISSALSCDDHVACTTDACNTQTNTCTHTPANDCQACDDVSDCNSAECVSAECVKNGDDKVGKCVYTNKEDHADCDDGNACTDGDQCLGGTCTPGTPKVCDAPNACQNSNTCNPDTGLCVPDNKDNGTPCADSNKCNGDETCSDGQCIPGTPVVCPEPETCFKSGVCQPETGTCTFDPQDQGTSCNDPTSCNGNEICDGAGHCNEGTPVTCDCENPCQVGRCEEGDGAKCVCDSVPDGTSCEDGDVCNGNGACQGGECNTGTPLDCNDQDSCTTDSCNVVQGCLHEDNGTCNPPPPTDCGNGTCDEGETCGTCPQDCGECASTCGNGVCDPGEDCNCSDCVDTEACVIEAQRLKCVQNLTSQGVNPETANNLAGQGICEALLEGESTIGGCSLNRGALSSGNWMGTALLCLATPLVLIPRRIRVRRRRSS
jgi:von Willebrand factor type A domain-containing protein